MAIIGKVGDVEVARVFDTSILGFTAQSWFPASDREALRPHQQWLCPTHYDAESGRFPMPVSSFVLRVAGETVLIDSCFGNDKSRPQFPEMHLLDTHYLQRLAQDGVRPEDVDYVLCTHLHVDHVGLNTRLLDGNWVPTFPNAQYVVSRKEFDAAEAELSNPQIMPVVKATFEDSILPIADAGKMLLVDDFHELLGCLGLTPYPGQATHPITSQSSFARKDSLPSSSVTSFTRPFKCQCGGGAPSLTGISRWPLKAAGSCSSSVAATTPYSSQVTSKRRTQVESTARVIRSPSNLVGRECQINGGSDLGIVTGRSG